MPHAYPWTEGLGPPGAQIALHSGSSAPRTPLPMSPVSKAAHLALQLWRKPEEDEELIIAIQIPCARHESWHGPWVSRAAMVYGCPPVMGLCSGSIPEGSARETILFEPLPSIQDTSKVMQKSEFKRQGLATRKAGGRARAKRLKGPWPNKELEAARPANGTEFSSVPFKNLEMFS